MFSRIISTTLIMSTFVITGANAKTHGRAWSSTCEGKFAASFQASMMPTVYSNRKTPNNSAGLNPPFTGLRPPAFSKQFKLPYDLAAELGYMVKNNVEIFYDFDWTHAAGKAYTFSSQGVNFAQQFGQYNSYGNYLGTRYYFTFKSSPIKPFVGLKIGVLSQNSVTVNQVATYAGGSGTSSYTYFGKLNSLAGGLQLGVDWQLQKYLSVTLKGEVVAASRRKGNFILNQPVQGSYKIGSTGAQIFIPITIGVKLSL